jgi:solute carrier family 35 protein E1
MPQGLSALHHRPKEDERAGGGGGGVGGGGMVLGGGTAADAFGGALSAGGSDVESQLQSHLTGKRRARRGGGGGGGGTWSQRALRTLGIAALLVVWYAACSIGVISNAAIVREFGYPTALTAIHTVTGLSLDVLVYTLQGNPSPFPLNRVYLWKSLPVALFLAFSKILTYWSYAEIPASLTHTVKSSAPAFSVLLSYLWFSKVPRRSACLSLVPITVGVTLAAANEMSFHLRGFIEALLATFVGVTQNVYTKVMLHSLQMEPVLFHMYASLISAVIIVPGALFELIDLGRAVLSPLPTASVPYGMLLVSIICHYVQNIASIYVLARVSVLSHQVANTMKRLVIIVHSVLYFANPVTTLNALGMALALCGFFFYGLARIPGAKFKPGDSNAPAAPANGLGATHTPPPPTPDAADDSDEEAMLMASGMPTHNASSVAAAVAARAALASSPLASPTPLQLQLQPLFVDSRPASVEMSALLAAAADAHQGKAL